MNGEVVQEYGLLAVGVGLVLAAFLVGRVNRQLLPAVLTLVGVAAIAGWMHERGQSRWAVPPPGMHLVAGATDLPSPVIETRPALEAGFELQDLRPAHRFEYAEEGLRVVAIDPGGRWGAVGTAAGRLAFLDLETRKEASATIVGRSPASGIHSLAFSPDGRRLAVGLMGRATVLEVPTGTQVFDLEFPAALGGRAVVEDLAIAPSGDVLVATGHPDLVFQDLQDGAGIGILASAEGGFARLAWSRDGRSLAAVGAERRALFVWPSSDLAALVGAGPRCRIQLPRDRWVDALAFGVLDPAGEALVTTLGSEQREAHLAVWDVASCEPRASYPLGTVRTLGLSLAPDGTSAVVFADEGTLAAIRIEDGAAVGTLETDPGAAVVLLSDAGQRLLVVSHADDRITLYERRGGS